MSYILTIETSGTNCSVAIAKDNEVISVAEENSGSFSHAEKLHVFIKAVLEQSGLSGNEINAVAVSQGPGSYTGLRIGVSSAKGLCFAWDLPLIALPTLQVLASKAKGVDADYIIPMLDARRMEVYAAVYNFELLEVRNTQAEIVDESSFKEYLAKGKVVFLGDAVAKCKEIITHPNAIFLDDYYPGAAAMVPLAYAKYKAEMFEDVAYFEPFYLKDFIAGKKKGN